MNPGAEIAKTSRMPTYELTGEVWRYPGKGGWHFVTSRPTSLTSSLCATPTRVARRERIEDGGIATIRIELED